MTYVALMLNIPWTILGVVAGLASVPKGVEFSTMPKAIIISVRSFWWYLWMPQSKGVRAMTIGNVVLLGQDLLDKDLEHELVHVIQFEREPFIFPFLYQYQSLKYGYRNNDYEKEAYDKAGNAYNPMKSRIDS
ncbi:MAG: hypothetical protein V4481_04930 [Patescibacteria group bacterium]